MKAKGLLKHVGFSFHDKADVLDELLTKHPEMEFVQLQINYADWEERRRPVPPAATRWPASTASPLSSWSRSRAACWRSPPETVAQVLKAAAPEKARCPLGRCALPPPWTGSSLCSPACPTLEQMERQPSAP